MTLKTFIIGDATHTGLIAQIVEPVIGLMLAAAIFFFIWNVFKVITQSNKPDELAQLKSRVIWGLVAIAAMASVWGLVNLILGSTGLNTGAVIDIRTGL